MSADVNYGAPWRVAPGDGEWLVIDRYGCTVLHCKARGIAEFVVAAPDLSAALKESERVLAEWIDMENIDDDDYPEAFFARDEARAALAKAARGEP